MQFAFFIKHETGLSLRQTPDVHQESKQPILHHYEMDEIDEMDEMDEMDEIDDPDKPVESCPRSQRITLTKASIRNQLKPWNCLPFTSGRFLDSRGFQVCIKENNHRRIRKHT
jgi:hypothetical protein